MLVRPILEYACVVWSLYALNIQHCRYTGIHRKVIAYKSRSLSLYPFYYLYIMLNWTSLKDRRDTLRVAMMYKIIDNMCRP